MTSIEQIRAALESWREVAETYIRPSAQLASRHAGALSALSALETEVSKLRAKVGEYEAAPTVAWLGVCDDGTKGAATCEKVRRLYERAGRHIYELIQRPQVTK